jgi:ABC-type transport system involved in multi-copper enzyme maturation permease subunit
MAKLLSSEFLRIRRYWLTWAIFTLLLIILILQVNGKINELDKLATEIETGRSTFDNKQLSTLQIEGKRILTEQIIKDLHYPASIGTIARLATGSGWFLIILFTAVVGGEDFTRKTLRSILSRGIGRERYLLIRCLALWLAAGFAVLVITLIATASGLYVHFQVTTDEISLEGLGDSLLIVLRSWLTYLPFIVVTLFWVVIARNAGPAMGLGIIMHTFERLLGMAIPAMLLPFSVLNPNITEMPPIYHILKVLLKLLSVTVGYNTDFLVYWGPRLHLDPAFLASITGLEGEPLLPSSPWRAVGFLAGYIILFLGWALRILRRRDLTYES